MRGTCSAPSRRRARKRQNGSDALAASGSADSGGRRARHTPSVAHPGRAISRHRTTSRPRNARCTRAAAVGYVDALRRRAGARHRRRRDTWSSSDLGIEVSGRPGIFVDTDTVSSCGYCVSAAPSPRSTNAPTTRRRHSPRRDRFPIRLVAADLLSLQTTGVEITRRRRTAGARVVRAAGRTLARRGSRGRVRPEGLPTTAPSSGTACARASRQADRRPPRRRSRTPGRTPRRDLARHAHVGLHLDVVPAQLLPQERARSPRERRGRFHRLRQARPRDLALGPPPRKLSRHRVGARRLVAHGCDSEAMRTLLDAASIAMPARAVEDEASRRRPGAIPPQPSALLPRDRRARHRLGARRPVRHPRLQDGRRRATRAARRRTRRRAGMGVGTPRRAGALRLRIRYEYLAAEGSKNAEPWEPDEEDLSGIEEWSTNLFTEIRSSSLHGVAEEKRCRACSFRSICTDSAAPSEPVWPALGASIDAAKPHSLKPMIDPRTPVLAGVGQCEQRCPPEEAASPIELFARRSSCCGRRCRRNAPRARRHRRHGRDRVVAVSRPEPARCRGARHRATPHRGQHHWWQQPATAVERARRTHPTRRMRCGTRGWRRDDPHSLAGAARAAHRHRVGDRRRTRVQRRDRHRGTRHRPVGDGASTRRAHERVSAVRDRAARRRRAHRRRAPARGRRPVVTVRRGIGRQPPRLVAAGLHPTRDRHSDARQPHGRLPVHEADVRQHRRRPKRGVVALFLRGCARGRRRRRPLGVPACGRRCARPLVGEHACLARPQRGDRGDRAGRARRVRARGRRRRPLRPLLLLPLGGADGDAVDRARRPARRRRPTAHGHGWTRIRRRSGQQLPHPRRRHHGRAIARRSGFDRPHHRARLVRHQAFGGRVVDAAAGARLRARRCVQHPGGRRRASPRVLRQACTPGGSTWRRRQWRWSATAAPRAQCSPDSRPTDAGCSQSPTNPTRCCR